MVDAAAVVQAVAKSGLRFAMRPRGGRNVLDKVYSASKGSRNAREGAMTLSVERDGPVTTIIRSRIEARNAMDPAGAEALTNALLAFDRDESQYVAVLWGAGGAFCAGFDLKYAG